MLLSGGKTCYFGPVPDMPSYFASIDQPIPNNTNPAEHLLDIVSSDFGDETRVETIREKWSQSSQFAELSKYIAQKSDLSEKGSGAHAVQKDDLSRPGVLAITLSLLHRLFIKSYRDVVAYGIRIVMYLGLFPLITIQC